LKKRIAANTALTALVFAIASKSLLIPSGIPIAIQNPIKSLFQKPSSGRLINPALRPSSVYNSLATEANKPQGKGALIVLIILESFGLTEDKSLNQFILSNIERATKPARKVKGYEISRASNDTSLGGTLGAELRYLCNLQTTEAFAAYKNFSTAQQSETSRCLPRLIRRNGGTSIYIHNGSKRFYNRDRIMTMIGFNRKYFQGPIVISDCLTKPFCGSDEASYSTAEADIAPTTGGKNNANLFIQIMTIDTHAPYLGHNDIIFSYKRKVSGSAKLLENFLARTLEIRKNLPTVIVLTSDHPTPLGSTKGNSQKMNDLPQTQETKLDNFVYIISNLASTP